MAFEGSFLFAYSDILNWRMFVTCVFQKVIKCQVGNINITASINFLPIYFAQIFLLGPFLFIQEKCSNATNTGKTSLKSVSMIPECILNLEMLV